MWPSATTQDLPSRAASVLVYFDSHVRCEHQTLGHYIETTFQARRTTHEHYFLFVIANLEVGKNGLS